MAIADSDNLEALQKDIAVFDSVSLINSAMGLCLSIDNQQAQCLISLFGAHVLSFINKQDKRERLWLSDKAIFDNKTPIRGGIPICWPWFGPHMSESSYPNHGFVRTQMWDISEIEEYSDIQDPVGKSPLHSQNPVSATRVVLTPHKLDLFGYKGLTVKVVIVISHTLDISLITYNNSQQVLPVSQALHSYFAVADINKIIIDGIDGNYEDKVANTLNNETPVPYRISQEVDRIHPYMFEGEDNKPDTHEVSITSENGIIQTISQLGHNSTVVWNPWVEKSQSMQDMANNGYKTMVCIEAASTNSNQQLSLSPQQSHKITQIIY